MENKLKTLDKAPPTVLHAKQASAFSTSDVNAVRRLEAYTGHFVLVIRGTEANTTTTASI